MTQYSQTGIAGIDTTPIGSGSGSRNIENFRYDQVLKCWVNDRALLRFTGPDSASFEPQADIYSVFSYKPHGNFKEHILFEQVNGATLDLKVLIGQKIYTLATGRHKQAANEPNSFYITYNNMIMIINGVDPALVYFGSRYVREAFTIRPNTISLSVPGMAIGDFGPEGIGLFTRYGNRSSGGALLQFSVESGYGVGLGARAIDYFDSTDVNFYTEQNTNTYEYVVSFVTDTGSESAMSGRSNRVSWLGNGITDEDDDTPKNKKVITARYGVELNDIPIGPVGTLKRRIYRTKNMGDINGGAGSELYYCMDLNDNISQRTIDSIPDTQLGSEKISTLDRLAFPQASLGASYGGRLVLAGIRDEPETLYVSDAGLPEQFRTQNIFAVPSARGGAITGLYPYNNLLLIFRESAIDALLQTNTGFQIVPIIDNVGSFSPHSIEAVQGIGTVFLGSDRNFYSVTGNYSGGSSIQITNISSKLGTKLIEINNGALQKAFAIYNPSDQEYWCHVPTKGLDICLDGFVLHTPTGGWSRRTNFPLSSATVCLEGRTVFGSLYKAYEDLTTTGAGRGILVWAGLSTSTTRPTSIFETSWLSLGSPQELKHVENVILYVYKNEFTTGNISLSGSVDYRPYVRSIATLQSKNSETSSPGIFGTAVLDGADSSTYTTWDKNRYSAREVITIRVAPNLSPDVGFWESTASNDAFAMQTATFGGLRWVKFKLTANSELRFIGYAIDYKTKDGKILQYSPIEGV